MLRVFLSSTFKDLIPERQAVEAAIQRMAAQYVGMEYFGSFAEEPLERCLKKVCSANVVILVLGHKYGFVAEGSQVSMTEAEYRAALDEKVPVLAYLIQEDSFSTHSDDNPKLSKLKDELKAHRGVSWFTSPEDLAWKVISDIAREFAGSLSPENPSAEFVQNQVLINPIRDRVDELIAILENRAKNIRLELSPYYKYAPVKKYLRQFKELHEKHVSSLRDGRLIQAHEVLSEIHKLSADLESDEFWSRHDAETPDVRYSLSDDAFQRGKLICEYVAGDMKAYSEKYPSSEGFVGYGWRHETGVPTISAKLYERILSSEVHSVLPKRAI
jgi:hypothetical protein